MSPATVGGTGPLVALLNRNDSHHSRCVDLFASIAVTLLVPTTVMVEVCWLLEAQPDVEARFLEAVSDGAFTLVPITTADLIRMAELVREYADFPRRATTPEGSWGFVARSAHLVLETPMHRGTSRREIGNDRS